MRAESRQRALEVVEESVGGALCETDRALFFETIVGLVDECAPMRLAAWKDGRALTPTLEAARRAENLLRAWSEVQHHALQLFETLQRKSRAESADAWQQRIDDVSDIDNKLRRLVPEIRELMIGDGEDELTSPLWPILEKGTDKAPGLAALEPGLRSKRRAASQHKDSARNDLLRSLVKVWDFFVGPAPVPHRADRQDPVVRFIDAALEGIWPEDKPPGLKRIRTAIEVVAKGSAFSSEPSP